LDVPPFSALPSLVLEVVEVDVEQELEQVDFGHAEVPSDYVLCVCG